MNVYIAYYKSFEAYLNVHESFCCSLLCDLCLGSVYGGLEDVDDTRRILSTEDGGSCNNNVAA